MNAPVLLKALHLATASAVVALLTQAAPSFAAGAPDDGRTTRAGGPRVEQRVTVPQRDTIRTTERTGLYARG